VPYGPAARVFGCRWRAGRGPLIARSRARSALSRSFLSSFARAWHDLTLQVQRMAGALRRTDWSSTPHPTPRGAPPESVCCLVSVTVMRASLGTVNTPELRRYDVIRYGGRTMVLEVVRRSAPYTRYLSPLWRRRSRMHFAFTLLIPSGKGWVVVYMCGRMRIVDA
jgi:hypothetical protein